MGAQRSDQSLLQKIRFGTGAQKYANTDRVFRSCLTLVDFLIFPKILRTRLSVPGAL